jgi:Flp pilus assembly protein TadG
MSTNERSRRSEQGAVFVQVGISLFVLMAFNVFVLDYGMMWIGRRQAQNAADAGALAGALARGYDDFSNPPSSGGLTAQSAQAVAAANLVWQQSATPRVLFNCPAGVTGRCVRVEVYRDGTNSSTALPTLFGPILGITTQGVKATATAITVSGNSTTCMKPWAMPDAWIENNTAGEFNAWTAAGAPLANPDIYTPPSATLAAGMRVSDHFGVRVLFDVNYPFNSPITDGFVLPLDLPGGRTYAQNMTSCNGQPLVLGQRLSINTSLGGGVAETALQDAYNLDPGADYNYGDSYVTGSCAPGCASVSPRLFAVALYDPNDFERRRAQADWADCPNGTPCVVATNIIGFFIHRLSGGGFGRHGHFLKYPGMTASGTPTFVDDASWLVTTHLIR